MSDSDPDPETDVPPELAETLREMETLELQRTVDYVQNLLRDRSQDLRSDVEAGQGEEIVRITEKDGYTEVVKRHPCAERCPDCPHEPYLYHVTVEKRPDGERTLHWTLIGRTFE